MRIERRVVDRNRMAGLSLLQWRTSGGRDLGGTVGAVVHLHVASAMAAQVWCTAILQTKRTERRVVWY
jgi:hypothetical protein